MPYHVSREGQTYGPYTLEDLQRYVASGNVLLTDLAKSDDSPDWIPVAQVLNPAAGAAAPAGMAAPGIPPYLPPAMPYGQPAAYGAFSYPDPPNLHWALVILISLLCGFFGFIWEIVQLNWLRKVAPQTKAIRYFVLAYVLGFIAAILAVSFDQGQTRNPNPVAVFLFLIFGIAAAVFYILYRFAMRDSLQEHFNGPEPIGLQLGPIMTFFFGSLYFQYHFNRINGIKRAGLYRAY